MTPLVLAMLILLTIFILVRRMCTPIKPRTLRQRTGRPLHRIR